ncbi:MAG TPA: hypothetical protein VK666_22820, partial [Chryseolinea sp.]|nr:hypothetical protein [Chryseolinea sp.]
MEKRIVNSETFTLFLIYKTVGGGGGKGGSGCGLAITGTVGSDRGDDGFAFKPDKAFTGGFTVSFDEVLSRV